jgi:hypothetical protein
MGSKIGWSSPPILNCQIQGQRKCSDFNLFIYLLYFSLFDDLHDLFAYEIFLQDQPKKFFFCEVGVVGGRVLT